VPAATAAFLAECVAVLPRPDVLAVTQDRLAEKRLFEKLGIAVPPFAEIAAEADLGAALAHIGRPAVLKTRRLGYDGKGQSAIRAGDDPMAAWRSGGGAPSILEAFVTFEREISVAVTRGRDGAMALYDISENRHADHILATARVPAAIGADVAAEARDIGRRIAEALNYVGVLAVELFVVSGPDGQRLLANEIAPRVHNSFHWTQDACLISQFEQHIRAVCGWPLGDPVRHSDVEMTNLIGDDVSDWRTLAAEPAARLHLYGKADARPGRKMGHVTRLLGPARRG
jgi:5-(carboxyamino)imidazole ribonucleotide synthase